MILIFPDIFHVSKESISFHLLKKLKDNIFYEVIHIGTTVDIFIFRNVCNLAVDHTQSQYFFSHGFVQDILCNGSSRVNRCPKSGLVHA